MVKRNRFKELDLVDRVPEELWTEVPNLVLEMVTKTISKKKKCKKVKWLSDEALLIAEERREAKGKSKRETYTQVNAKFQRIARRYKKTFLSEPWGTEENNRMGKTRNLFKKTGEIKGTFHARMSTIKDRNGKDLTEAEEIKERLEEYTEELYKKGLDDLDYHSGMISHPLLDILECEVK